MRYIPETSSFALASDEGLGRPTRSTNVEIEDTQLSEELPSEPPSVQMQDELLIACNPVGQMASSQFPYLDFLSGLAHWRNTDETSTNIMPDRPNSACQCCCHTVKNDSYNTSSNFTGLPTPPISRASSDEHTVLLQHHQIATLNQQNYANYQIGKKLDSSSILCSQHPIFGNDYRTLDQDGTYNESTRRSPVYRFQEATNEESAQTGPWTKQEDQELMQGVCRHFEESPDLPIPWTRLGRGLSRVRTGAQCQAHYTESLDPTVLRGRWTAPLDDALLHLAHIHRNSWTKVSAGLVGKTQRQCRSRWLALQKRHRNLENLLPTL